MMLASLKLGLCLRNGTTDAVDGFTSASVKKQGLKRGFREVTVQIE